MEKKNTFLRTCLAPPLPVSVPVYLRTNDPPPASLNPTSGFTDQMVADEETFGLLDNRTGTLNYFILLKLVFHFYCNVLEIVMI